MKRGIKELTNEEEQDQGQITPGMKFGVSQRCLGGEKTQSSRERSKRMDLI